MFKLSGDLLKLSTTVLYIAEFRLRIVLQVHRKKKLSKGDRVLSTLHCECVSATRFNLELLIMNVDKDNWSFHLTGTYCHLVAKFVFRRRLAYSFIQIYSPTFLIVVLSWLSFWISKDAVPARVALGITTVLTIVTLMGSLRNSVPKVK